MRCRSKFGWMELMIGILLIVLGIFTFLRPGSVLTGAVLVYGVFALITGIADIVFYVKMERHTGFGPVVALVSGILSNLNGLFDSINSKVGEVAAMVGQTPQSWNSSIFSMVRSLSDNVMIPIAGVILTLVACMELIQMLIDRNNMHDTDVALIFRWVMKTSIATILVTNTWNIVMGIFDVAQSVVSKASGVVLADTSIDLSAVLGDLEARLMEMEVGTLFGLWFQSTLMGLIAWALAIAIFVVVYGRMIEIYCAVSVAPIPLATMAHREWGQMGQNYLRSLLALGFQAFLIILCVAIYAVLVKTISVDADLINALWTCIGYTVLLCFTLFKTSSVSKSIFNAH